MIYIIKNKQISLNHEKDRLIGIKNLNNYENLSEHETKNSC